MGQNTGVNVSKCYLIEIHAIDSNTGINKAISVQSVLALWGISITLSMCHPVKIDIMGLN